MARRRRRRSGFGILFKIPESAYRKARKKVAADQRVWRRYNPDPKKRKRGMSLPAGAPRHATNRDRSVIEVFKFQNRKAATPFTAYMDKSGWKVKNWMGIRLCDVVKIRGAAGITAKCIDGRTYVGRSNGPGMWIKLRPKSGR